MEMFGQRIRRYRRAQELTLEALARRIRTTKGYLSGIENGKVQPPRVRFVTGLCRVLGLDPHAMLALSFAEKAPKDVRAEFLQFVEEKYFISKAIL